MHRVTCALGPMLALELADGAPVTRTRLSPAARARAAAALVRALRQRDPAAAAGSIGEDELTRGLDALEAVREAAAAA